MGKFLEALYDDLSLHVRQSAWLNTAPQRAKNDKSEAPRLSRLEKLRRDLGDAEHQPEMPPVDAEYLIAHLFEVGPVMAAGGYPGPLTHQEICFWAELTGIELAPWEVRFLRRLSSEYFAESQRAEQPDCQAPVRQASASDMAAVAKTLQQALREMAKR